MKTISKILTAAALMLAAVTTHAQEREAAAFTAADLHYTGVAADSVLALADTSFLLAWNWLTMDRDASQTLRINAWHCHDPYAWWPAMDSNARRARTPGQLMLVAVADVTTDRSNEGAQHTAPAEAVAMEWQPWLVPEADTFALRADDSTGGVWGFHSRHASGTVVQDGTDGCYRYRMQTANFTGPTQVLTNVERKDGFYKWPTHNGRFSTDTLWLAVNLRRNDTDSDVGKEDNVVLRLRVPFWTADTCRDGRRTDSVLARFRLIPVATGGTENVTSQLGTAMGTRWGTIEVSTAPTEIAITRRMLPQVGAAEEDITIYAQVIFDLLPGTTDPGHPWRNRRFNRRDFGDVASTNRVSVDVTFEDDLGVDVKSVRLESHEARELFWGQKDADIRDAVQRHVDRAILYNRDSVAVPGDQPRMMRIYGRDEIEPMHWKGFRYINRLLRGDVTTEWNIHDLAKARHCLRLREYWQGTTLQMTPHAPSPCFRHGRTSNAHVDTLDLYGDLAYGRMDRPSYEMFLETYRQDLCNTASLVYNGTLPLTATEYDTLIGWYGNGVLGQIERMLDVGYRNAPQLLFDPTIRWMANIWEFGSLTGYRDLTANRRWLRQSPNGRTKSHAEMLLQLWQPLILGAKGLIHYCGGTYHQLPPTINHAAWGAESEMIVDLGAAHSVATLWNVTPTGDARIDDDVLGGDYLTATDPTNLQAHLPFGLAATAAALNHQRPNPPGMFLGRKSMRQTIRQVQRGLHPHLNALNTLRLIGWLGHGYRRTMLGDSASTAAWLRLDAASQVVRVPAKRDLVTGDMHREDTDSMFFDLTLLRAGDTSLADVAYVGVVNRRTDVRFDTTSATGGTYLTFDEVRDSLAVHPTWQYAQHGARRVGIPFGYTHRTGEALNLRVRELRVPDSTGHLQARAPIDTVVGRHVCLEVDLLPGEGKIFRVEPVAAAAASGRGYLDHSNQRKIVAFPVVDTLVEHTDTNDGRTYMRMVVGDTMYYHKVYHRRRIDTTMPNQGVTSVYYRRSEPLVTPRDSATGNRVYAFNASTIVWQPEILVSDRVMYQAPGQEQPQEYDLSCGYPALVVRCDTTDTNVTSKVYVVFGCEWRENNQPARVLVCESVLPAEMPNAAQRAYYDARRSEVLDVTPAPNEPILEHWGTPSVNASARGNFYAWSHAVNGIGMGFKYPSERRFAGNATAYVRGRNGQGMVATHPSLNTYSRLQLGEEDAAVVWQEGPNPDLGNFIFLTRLWYDPALGLMQDLNAAGAAGRFVQGPALVDVQDPTLAMISDAWITIDTTIQGLAWHRRPVIYRHLSDWETTPANLDHHKRKVNHKADRIYWECAKWSLGALPSMIARRVVDVHEWSLAPAGGVDTLWSMAEHFIYDTTRHLRGPDVAQGEQWGEPGSVPNDMRAEHEDSTMVLNFWSETSATDPAPMLWHMTHGWRFYGQDVDHEHTDLVGLGLMVPLHEVGRFPHLAARASMPMQAGWQRNRRIYDSTDGSWPNYAVAPRMRTSSERFYRPAAEEATPATRLHVGWRAGDRQVLTAPVRVGERLLPLTAAHTDKQGVPTLWATSWFTLPKGVTDVEAITTHEGPDACGDLEVERRTDGERVALRAMAVGAPRTMRQSVTALVADDGEEYRIVLAKDCPGLHAVEDIEIHRPSKDDAMARAAVADGGMIDLRTMSRLAPAGFGTMLAMPNPARDRVTLVWDLRAMERGRGLTTAHLEISDVQGRSMLQLDAPIAGRTDVDVGAWSVGTYTARVSTNGPAATSAGTLIVVRP